MTTPIKITGVSTTPGPNGSIPIRREIRDLQRSFPDQWNLYLLALRAFQIKDEGDMLSYYQIAGIHGRPTKPWNGVLGRRVTQSEYPGYCTHSSILFLPWHRPYLALFEQVLYDTMQKIAVQFPLNMRDRYVNAAKTFRIPYWDWAIQPPTGNVVPSSIVNPTVTVIGTNGQQQTIPNPLARFTFNPLNPTPGDFPDSPYNIWLNTIRYPRSGAPSDGGNSAAFIADLNNDVTALRDKVNLILASISNYEVFSNNRWIPGNPNYAGLEDIHDDMHVNCGGRGGHMSNPGYSAFDPVFWLHHTNVDRLFAIWQALRPDSYVTPHVEDFGNFTTAAGTTVDSQSDLKPFWKDDRTFWDSNDSRTTETFGYVYPETQKWNYATTLDYQRSVALAVNTLYGSGLQSFAQSLKVSEPPKASAAAAPAAAAAPTVAAAQATAPSISSTLGGGMEKLGISAPSGNPAPVQAPIVKRAAVSAAASGAASAKPAPGDVPKGVKEAQIVMSKPNPNPAPAGATAPKPKGGKAPAGGVALREWIANVRVQKHGLAGSFQIHFFLGDFSADPDAWLDEANKIASWACFGSDAETTGCDKCVDQAAQRMNVTGVVPLTTSLIKSIQDGQLASLNAVDVEPYLTRHLHWRVTKMDGSEHPRDQVPDLKISVVSTDVTIPDDPAAMPVYSGQYRVHHAVTQGRPGGLNEGDPI